MKCPRTETARASNMEKSSAAAEAKMLRVKTSPVKNPAPVKPQCPPAEVTTALFSVKNDTSAVHNKENNSSKEEDGTLHEGFEDSGYLSLQNSQIEYQHGEEEEDHILGKSTAIPPSAASTRQEKTASPGNSPSKCQRRTHLSCPVSLLAVSTPVDRPRRTTAEYSQSSTPSDQDGDLNLPILKFQRAVCKELAKSYQKNKRYDWSIVSKVADNHLLDRVIGGHMGLEYVDIFTSLLSRNMRHILTNVLALLGDMDLISCKKVSRTWKKIICEDTAALKRCQRAERALKESRSSLRQRGCGLTRDVATSRVVLSSMQTLASTKTPSSSSSSSSTPSCRSNRKASSQKGSTPNSQRTRFKDYVQAASSLKQHESLRSCKRCGSPATHSAEIQRARCTRLDCLFDFCTLCQESFHNSTPCRTVQPRSHFPTSKATPVIPRSTRSRGSIRRL
ncbi:F-box only protein 5 [Brachyistius frenatus]|uniref:F-box only protein 5 n=1 Tax=Brachyistius frenatus TaxID=100188 RepID=UPI0037E78588